MRSLVVSIINSRWQKCATHLAKCCRHYILTQVISANVRTCNHKPITKPDRDPKFLRHWCLCSARMDGDWLFKKIPNMPKYRDSCSYRTHAMPLISNKIFGSESCIFQFSYIGCFKILV